MTNTYVDTRDVPVGALTPFPGNARKGDVDSIRQSLRANGQFAALVVRRTPDALVVLSGNHTLQALKAEKHKTARCQVIECDDATALRINLAANRTGEIGTYDTDALADLLQLLDTAEGTGWTDAEVAKILQATADEAVAEVMPEPGDAPVDEPSDTRWGVIVEVSDEAAQVELLQRLAGEGFDVRALMA